jgi:tight adherence protein B
MSSLVVAACAAVGVYLLLTRSRRSSSAPRRPTVAGLSAWVEQRLKQAGLSDVSPLQFAGASGAVGMLALVPAAALFGVGPSALIVAVAAACLPAAAWRNRRAAARRAAREAWPRLIEELRVLTGSVGRSIPQALLEVGLRGPVELRPAFEAAQREWALTTDFERTVEVLKHRLADPTADATCETLLVAAQVGGDIDSRLQALAEDRRQDLQGRQEAIAKQAGAKLARLFVIVVPAGMALAGMSVGDGAAAYRSAMGQLLVTLGIVVVVVCWWWASRIMRLPESGRVFDR